MLFPRDRILLPPSTLTEQCFYIFISCLKNFRSLLFISRFPTFPPFSGQTICDKDRHLFIRNMFQKFFHIMFIIHIILMRNCHIIRFCTCNRKIPVITNIALSFPYIIGKFIFFAIFSIKLTRCRRTNDNITFYLLVYKRF